MNRHLGKTSQNLLSIGSPSVKTSTHEDKDFFYQICDNFQICICISSKKEKARLLLQGPVVHSKNFC